MKSNVTHANLDRYKIAIDILQNKKEGAEAHLMDFTKLMWSVIERTLFVDNWHLFYVA